jgi:hypothetical protein
MILWLCFFFLKLSNGNVASWCYGMAAHCVCYGYFWGCEFRDSHRVLNMACCNLFNVCKSGLLLMPR